MKAESEMPLQVSTAPTTTLLLSTIISDEVRESNVMPESISSSTNASHSLGAGLAVGGDHPIVLNRAQAQNLLEGGNIRVPKATCSSDSPIESRHAKIFSEHRKTTSIDAYPNSNEQQAPQQQHITTKHSLSKQLHVTEDKHHDTIIQHSSGSVDLTRSGGLNLSSASTEFSPITKQPAEEERNRELHLGLSTIDNSNNIPHINRRRIYEPHYQQLQHQHALAALTHLPQPPAQYTATAADIALGITPSYCLSRNMSDGTRMNSMTSYADLYRYTKRDATSFQGKETDEDASRTSATSSDSITALSPGMMTPIHDTSSERIIVGTPSTVSTAPSSDDEALLEYKLDETSTLPNLLHPLQQSQNTFAEDVMFSPHDSQKIHRGSWQSIQELQRNHNHLMQQTLHSNLQNAPSLSFDRATSLKLKTHHYPLLQQQSQHRVASFRNEVNFVERPKNDEKAHESHTRRSIYLSSPKEHNSPQHLPHRHHHQRLQNSANKKISYAYQVTPKSTTPPKSGRNQRHQGNRQVASGGQGSSPHQPGSSLQRSSSEVLKTLLRKKACLYEPYTSRAVALVTWLVGRLLALEFGFFSRQQLQCGVHACVSKKIEAGTITRTKVNRCMQIILNSCFHYIIPRSDGTEEKGDYFRDAFSETVEDDSLLLKELPEPWNDLVVDRDTIINAILQDIEEKNAHQTSILNQSPSTSPRLSPKLGSINAEKNPDRYLSDGEKEEASKRAVLLCFNENVRSAEDVFRCHNDFIRDTANASHLQLSAQEWGQFFGIEAFRDPHFLGNVGVSMRIGAVLERPQILPDLLGRMSLDELGKFRTTWCTKRYEHDHDLCGFAHIEVNGGWLRRNPMNHYYKKEMCKFVTCVRDDMVSPGNFFLNECPHGLVCDYAHSVEEIHYHPLNYKNSVCTSTYSRSGGCRLGDVCPNAHPPNINRPLKKLTPDGRSLDKRGKKNFEQGKTNAKSLVSTLPIGSPIVYASPAPISKFERQLVMPGLQNLYRRQSEVIRAYVNSSGKCKPTHSLFCNKFGISDCPST